MQLANSLPPICPSDAARSMPLRRVIVAEGSSVQREHRHEGILRDLDRADPLHPLLALLLLLEQLSLARDVTPVALGKNILAERRDRLPGDDLAADRRLDGNFEHLAGDDHLQLLYEPGSLRG